MERNSKNLILDLSFSFALSIIEYCEILESSRKFIVSNQLLRSATSIGAMINEAQGSESRNDFIHKMKIAAKEAEESSFWLKLCNNAVGYPKNQDLLDQIHVLNKVLTKIISTAKQNTPNHR